MVHNHHIYHQPHYRNTEKQAHKEGLSPSYVEKKNHFSKYLMVKDSMYYREIQIVTTPLSIKNGIVKTYMLRGC